MAVLVFGKGSRRSGSHGVSTQVKRMTDVDEQPRKIHTVGHRSRYYNVRYRVVV